MKLRAKHWLILTLLSLPLLSLVAMGFYRSFFISTESYSNIPRLDWQQLRQLDLKTGIAPSTLNQYNGQKVRIPGFVVPLEDNASQASEFLLVPNPQACIHVPPPPANQMVHIRMEGAKVHKLTYGPIWVIGVLRIMETENVYGKVSYYLTAENTDRYKD